ncbi:TrkH family potassium uptake protein [Staphylococcus canis]|uniref:TrkH family potassium uptake protein n=1 Tax=Staphylococcus canis TaxID=2724942 RepID=A0ABS0T6Z9_9STAP|nr:TrkH family potassium uptake protein [Staphylococcus canis]MBI5974519.1 TrkH family potassium uptake protein [Staphylococcus canis]
MYSKKQPIVFYIALFLSTTLIGSLLLYLPWTGQKHTSFIDALYVATSAFTVTGLSTVDISTQFNIFGQTVIMLLIQIGGIGIVAVSMFALMISQKHVSIQGHQLLQLEMNTDDINSVTDFAKFILFFNVLFESLGTFVLSFVFVPKLGWSDGLFTSLFTSISALNNAGFSLFSDNLISYAQDPVVNLMIAFLIIAGGIGYVVLIDIVTTHKIKHLQLHSKVTILMTFILIVAGFIVFLILEQQHSLKGMSLSDQVLASFFQSVTTRTAGFNTIDFSQVAPGTLMFTMILMFIGAGPISAAGGIKITTFALIIIYIITSLKGHEHAHLFKRSIPNKQMQKAIAITLSALSFTMVITFFIATLQPNLNFEDISFEVISAFGTVGLSTGISAEYGLLSKLLIIVTMIVGKIGIITLLGLLQRKTRETFHYAKGNLYL